MKMLKVGDRVIADGLFKGVVRYVGDEYYIVEYGDGDLIKESLTSPLKKLKPKKRKVKKHVTVYLNIYDNYVFGKYDKEKTILDVIASGQPKATAVPVEVTYEVDE